MKKALEWVLIALLFVISIGALYVLENWGRLFRTTPVRYVDPDDIGGR